jgi:uncharacterized paraquat-inducible protein A
MPPMRRFLVDLLLAHMIASYGVVAGIGAVEGWPPGEVWLVAPVVAPVAVWDAATNPPMFRRPRASLAAAVGGYGACFAATVALRRAARRRRPRKPRGRQGVCSECGYDLTGNVSGRCPECGLPVSRKARLLIRRNS